MSMRKPAGRVRWYSSCGRRPTRTRRAKRWRSWSSPKSGGNPAQRVSEGTMHGKAVYFEGVDIGDEITPLTFTPTRELIAAYVKACNITEKRFTDDAYAR